MKKEREELSSEHIAVSISEYMGKGESILIVDDVKGQRDLAEEMLGKLNYSVKSVSSGEEAMAYFIPVKQPIYKSIWQGTTINPELLKQGNEYSSTFSEAFTAYKPFIVCHIFDSPYCVFPDNKHIIHTSLQQ